MNVDPLDSDNLTMYEVLRHLVDRIPSTSERERARLIQAVNNAEFHGVFKTEGQFRL